MRKACTPPPPPTGSITFTNDTPRHCVQHSTAMAKTRFKNTHSPTIPENPPESKLNTRSDTRYRRVRAENVTDIVVSRRR